MAPEAHVELTRSDAAEAYVWKDDTAVEGTRFELGRRPGRVSREESDYDEILAAARRGDFDSIPSSFYIRHHRALKSIAGESLTPRDVPDRVIKVFWGASGTGKSHTARCQAAQACEDPANMYEYTYIKDPKNKWWDGYNPDKHINVIVDEYAGGWAVEHFLRWTDKWGSLVEVKGATLPFLAKNVWFTSNIDPALWYPDATEDQKTAVRRRIRVTHFADFFSSAA